MLGEICGGYQRSRGYEILKVTPNLHKVRTMSPLVKNDGASMVFSGSEAMGGPKSDQLPSGNQMWPWGLSLYRNGYFNGKINFNCYVWLSRRLSSSHVLTLRLTLWGYSVGYPIFRYPLRSNRNGVISIDLTRTRRTLFWDRWVFEVPHLWTKPHDIFLLTDHWSTTVVWSCLIHIHNNAT